MITQNLIDHQKKNYSEFIIPSAPSHPNEYNIFQSNPMYSYRQDSSAITESTDDNSLIFEEVSRYDKVSRDEDVSVFVIYFCAFISLFMPIIGFIYLCCFRFCCGVYPFNSQKARKAYKILMVTTFIGVLFNIIFGSLISYGIIKLN